MSRYARILVATDGSESCEAAVDAAIDLATGLGAEVIALSVAHEPDATDADLSAVADPVAAAEAASMAIRREDEAVVEARAAGCAARAADRARSAGVTARAVTWEGPSGPSIVAAATAERADLVVVGSRSRNVLGRVVAGSVSDYVVHHSPVPVMVVRPPR
jgi:nucleotide-binding universal stress UspA family protein